MPHKDRQFEEWLKPFAHENGHSTVQPKADDGETPTREAYADPDAAFGVLNERFFDGSLPDCVITFNRRRDGATLLRPGAFARVDGTVAHEISLNLPQLSRADERLVLATILCAQVSLWDRLTGEATSNSARNYHGLRFARKMEEVGLIPVARVTGKKTGYAMSFEIVPGGLFDLDCAELLASGFKLRWRDNAEPRGDLSVDGDEPSASPPRNTRTRFVCGCCDVKAWSRASARLACVDCDQPLTAS
ncbi:MAG: hypothetical protein WDZ83_14350 [Rhizobiaceae bacterium]